MSCGYDDKHFLFPTTLIVSIFPEMWFLSVLSRSRFVLAYPLCICLFLTASSNFVAHNILRCLFKSSSIFKSFVLSCVCFHPIYAYVFYSVCIRPALFLSLLFRLLFIFRSIFVCVLLLFLPFM
jgi:hypothetical protein